MMKLRKYAGFSLIEMMITILIIGITTLTAVYLFTDQLKRGRRIDAVNALLSISLAEERYRSNNTTYGTIAQVWGGVTTSSEGYYTLAISNVSATSYTITATAVGIQATDSNDSTSCTPLVLAVSSGTITKTPTVCWPS